MSSDLDWFRQVEDFWTPSIFDPYTTLTNHNTTFPICHKPGTTNLTRQFVYDFLHDLIGRLLNDLQIMGV